jgi:threonine dehydrogenase-like Zn-dependent dehydrogenase
MAIEKGKTNMRAAVLTGPRNLKIMNVAMPEPGDHVIIRITACGICGSDLHYWEMGTGAGGTTGLILGHEFVGTVFHPGVRSDLSFGERVTALPADPCGTCSSCIAGLPNLCSNFIRRRIPGNTGPGAYAEYLSVRSDESLAGKNRDIKVVIYPQQDS